MKIPLKIEKITDDVDCFEDIEKIIKYKLTNENRHVIRNLSINAQTIKEDGNKTKVNYCKKITGIRTELLPNESCEISCYIKLNKDFSEMVEIKGKKELSAIELDIKVTGTLYISKV